jgi:NADP-dependent aldehyde dehydrogenase
MSHVVEEDSAAAGQTSAADPGPRSVTVDQIVAATARASEDLRRLGIAGRARLLHAMAEELLMDGNDLVATAERETALGEERLWGEVRRTAAQLEMFARVVVDGAWLEVTIDHANPEAVPARPDLRRMLVPLGTVAVFEASNFPFAFGVAGGDTASALAVGCPAVVKVHPGHPQTSALVARALHRACAKMQVSPDVVGIVTGFDEGAALVRHPMIQAVGFTGSLGAGRHLFDLAAARPTPIPFYGELASVNALVVTPNAASDRAAEIAEGLVNSVTLGHGQFCTRPGLVFVPETPEGTSLIKAVVARAASVPAKRMLTDEIEERYLTAVAALAAHPAATIETIDLEAPTPAVLTIPAEDIDDGLLGECFGPAVILATYQEPGELLQSLASLPGALAGGVHLSPADEASDFPLSSVVGLLRERVGRLVFNDYPTGVAVTWSMQHGGPYPSTTASTHTSVGAQAGRRFLRPVTYQNTPAALIPPELSDDNPLQLPRRVDGELETSPRPTVG